jgi:hypothetical protein
MYLHELDEECFDEIDIDKPVKGLYFWILTEFNLHHPEIKNKLREDEIIIIPDTYATFPEAMDIADEYAYKIKNRFKGSNIRKLEPHEMENEFHIYILDKTNIEIARIAVVAEDYRGVTLH